MRDTHISGLLVITGLLLSACGIGPRDGGGPAGWLPWHRAPAPTTLDAMYGVDADSTEIPWALDEPYFIVISRTCGRLDLFEWGHLVRRYPAVFGLNRSGAKLYEGDHRTPKGFYRIIEKRHHRRWARFLLLDYPNATDADRYIAALEAGTVPVRRNRAPGIGGKIGIHGSDKKDLNARGIDWTYGCISITNRDVIELDALVPVGTPVLIDD